MILLLASLAQAQDVVGGDVPTLNSQLFRPSLDSTRTLWVDESLRARNAYTSGRAVLHYMNDPLVYLEDDGTRHELVSGVWQLDLMVGHTRGPLRLGLDLPVYLRSMGEAGGETGLGDVGLDARVTALDRTQRPVGLAVTGRLGLPTSTVSSALGAGRLSYEVGLVVDKTLVDDKLLLAANVGQRGQPGVQLENLTWDDQLYARLGAGYSVTERSGLSLEFASHSTWTDLGTEAARPIEGLLGGWRGFGSEGQWVLRGGLGTGLNGGVGAPKYRLVMGLGYEPSRNPDRDEDGILDADDDCPTEAEDFDGVLDADGCPEPTVVTFLAVTEDGKRIRRAEWSLSGVDGKNGDTVELYGGPHPFAVAAQGFDGEAGQVQVEDVLEQTIEIELVALPGSVVVRAVDPDGQPLDAVFRVKSTGDSELPMGESVELPPGAYELIVTAPGYRPVGRKVRIESEAEALVEVELVPSKAEVTQERIEIRESVYFETGKDVIKTESYGLLDDVAAIVVAHPELTSIRIEGHTDSRGGSADNLDLSQRRADSVKRYLMEQGVEADRLEAVGYGEERPLDARNTPSAWAKNRRVDFFVAGRSDE